MRLVRSSLSMVALIAAVSAVSAAGVYSTFAPATGALTGNEDVAVDTNIPNGANPQTYDVTVQQLRAAAYQQITPVTGFTATFAGTQSILSLTPAATLATGTVILPAAPVDGQRARIFTTQTITALTISPSTGQTINGTAVTTLSANAGVEYFYQASSGAWYRDL